MKRIHQISEDWIVMSITAILFILFFVGVWTISQIASSVSCNAKWDQNTYHPNYSIFAGCQIQIDGHYVPADQYRVM